jgi:hypothetical protein
MLFLGSLAEWWRNRRRCIFQYHDGFRWRRCDPVAAGNRLEEACPEYAGLLASLADDPRKAPPGPLRQSLVDQQRSAARDLANVARRVFGLLPLSEVGTGGVTDAEAVGVIARYLNFMERLARDSELFRTWPESGSPSPPASTTAPSVGSGTGDATPSGGWSWPG